MRTVHTEQPSATAIGFRRFVQRQLGQSCLAALEMWLSVRVVAEREPPIVPPPTRSVTRSCWSLEPLSIAAVGTIVRDVRAFGERPVETEQSRVLRDVAQVDCADHKTAMGTTEPPPDALLP